MSRTRPLRLSAQCTHALFTALALIPAIANADPATTDAERIEALERRIRQLEEKLEAVIASKPAAATPAPAATASPAPEAPSAPAVTADPVQEKFDQLDQQVRIVSRKLEIEQEAAAARIKDSPVLLAGREGFGLRSADGAFRLRIGGTIHADTRAYFENEVPGAAPDAFVLRRVRPNLEGTVGEKFGFRVQPEFGNVGTQTLLDAHVDLNFTPAFRIRAGKFKAPVGLERLQSPADMPFIERAFPTQLLPNRDIGIQVHGDVLDNRLTYAAGYFNGVRDGQNGDGDTSSAKDFNARVFAHPFRDSDDDALRSLGLGVAFTSGDQSGTAASTNLATYLSPGQQTIFAYAPGTVAAGLRQRWSPQFYYYNGPLGLFGEYALSSVELARGTHHARVTNRAWQLYVTYFLTGEDASFTRVTPRTSFDAQKDTWGAFEIMARISELHVDDATFEGSAGTRFADPGTSVRDATDLGLGLNWHLNRNIRLQTNFDVTRFKGGTLNGGDLPAEKVLITRFQAAF